MFSNIRTRTISISSYLTNRTPAIRFRYGPSREQKTSGQATAAQSTATTKSAAAAGSNKQEEAIYDFQLPERWRRRPLSEEEIAYINRGGPE